MKYMQQQLIKISELKNNTGQVEGLPKNPRFIKDHKYAKLKASLEADPEMMELREVIAYDNNGELVVICGNMRLRALKELGVKEVPVKVLPKETPAEKLRAYTIKDNVGFGEDSWDDLANDWNPVELEEWGLELPDLFGDAQEVDAQEDDYESPDVDTIETDIVPGDLFEIGEHRLLCGDSTTTDSYDRLMQGEQADMCVTDPPYNVAYEGKTADKMKIQNDSMSASAFYQFLYDFYTALTTCTKKGGAIYVWHASSEVVNFAKAMVDAGWLLKQQLIWVKNSMVMGRQDYQWKHEPCLYGWLEGAAHNWYSDRSQTTVIEFNRPNRNAEHPTMKPVGLFAYQIQNSSKKGDIVIDPFAGSGTTMVACEETGRKARVIELDPKYCAVIIDRMIKAFPGIEIKKNGEAYIAEAMA